MRKPPQIQQIQTQIQIKQSEEFFQERTEKIYKSKKSGSGKEEIYVPKLWYYKLLLFTPDQETSLRLVSNDTDDSHDKEDFSNNEVR